MIVSYAGDEPAVAAVFRGSVAPDFYWTGEPYMLKTTMAWAMYLKVIGFNGSPRKNGNSAALLTAALEGASDHGAATERVDLYDLSY